MLPLLTEILHLEQMPDVHIGLSLEGCITAGDTDATLASQICLILAALADVSIRQELAILAGINARGQLTSTRCINERIERSEERRVGKERRSRRGLELRRSSIPRVE